MKKVFLVILVLALAILLLMACGIGQVDPGLQIRNLKFSAGLAITLAGVAVLFVTAR